MSDTQRMSTEDKEFYRGFAVAVGTVARNGYGSIALDAMTGNGVTIRQLEQAGAEAFDLEYLKREAKLGGRL